MPDMPDMINKNQTAATANALSHLLQKEKIRSNCVIGFDGVNRRVQQDEKSTDFPER